jgi:hypothetical protein
MSLQAASVPAGAQDVSMTMVLDQRLGYGFEEGPDPETVAVTITFEILDGSGTATVDGRTQYLPFEEVVAQSATPPIEIVLDPQGSVVSLSVGGRALPAEMLALVGGGAGADVFQQPHLGPVFPDHPVAVGQEWEIDLSQTVMGFEISQRGAFRLVGEESLGGVPVLRIEGTIVTGDVEMSLADIIDAIGEEGLTGVGGGVDPAVASAQGVGMTMRMERSETAMTAWFDPDAGVVRRAEIDMPASMTVEMSGMPGSEDASMEFDLVVSQTLELES